MPQARRQLVPVSLIKLRPIAAVARKNFVGTVAGQHDGDLLPRRLRHKEGGYRGGIGEGLVEPEENAIKHVRGAIEVDGNLVVFGTEMARNLRRRRPLF